MTDALPYWSERRWTAMGSTAHVIVGDAPPHVVDWAPRELERLEQCWSRFRPDSELNRLGAYAGVATRVSPTLLLALRRARELWERTDGAFDPTVRRVLEELGYDRTFARVERVQDDAAPATTAAPGFGNVELDVACNTVVVPRGTTIDLGGVGKGLAADLLALGLVVRGARSAVVSLGGDIRVAGEPPDDGWDVPVEDPRDEGRELLRHRLAHGALVTCTTTMRTWSRGGVSLHHVIDPRSGRPANARIVAVIATGPETWLAEGVAKAVIVAGRERGDAMLHAAGVSALVVYDDGSLEELGAAGLTRPGVASVT